MVNIFLLSNMPWQEEQIYRHWMLKGHKNNGENSILVKGFQKYSRYSNIAQRDKIQKGSLKELEKKVKNTTN